MIVGFATNKLWCSWAGSSVYELAVRTVFDLTFNARVVEHFLPHVRSKEDRFERFEMPGEEAD